MKNNRFFICHFDFLMYLCSVLEKEASVAQLVRAHDC